MHRALPLLFVAACGGESLVPAPPPWLPPLEPTSASALGPYDIGVTTMSAEGAEGRVLPVEVWYPARPDDALPLERYRLSIGPLVVAELDSPLGARRDAPVDRRGAPHPVIMFSHGSGGTRLQSLYLTEYLASHGFVVAAPDHLGNTFAEEVNRSQRMPRLEVARIRPEDVSRTLDALLVRNDGWPADLLALALDGDRIGVAGHSFGGYTALRLAGASIDVPPFEASCAGDDSQFFCDGFPPDAPFPVSHADTRVRAALAQAPGGALMFGQAGYGSIDVPTMIQAGTDDTHTPYQTEAREPFEALGAPAWLLSVEHAGHFTFSDMCTLLELLGIGSIDDFDDGCGEANIATSDAHPIIDKSATAFFRVFVAGDDSHRSELDAEPGAGASLERK